MNTVQSSRATGLIRKGLQTLLQRVRTFLLGRFCGFGVVGVIIMIIGILLLYVLVNYCNLNKPSAYFIQAIVSVELNFACNKLFNWRDRKGALFSQWLRFHTTKVGTILFNQLLFGFLIAHGIYYLLATLIGVALATIINYVINDKFVFIPGKVVAHVDKPV